jgi:hypothetical protein
VGAAVTVEVDAVDPDAKIACVGADWGDGDAQPCNRVDCGMGPGRPLPAAPARGEERLALQHAFRTPGEHRVTLSATSGECGSQYADTADTVTVVTVSAT